MKHVKHISSIKYTQHEVAFCLLGVKNIFNQLKDEETLQGYATESHKWEKFQQKTREKKKKQQTTKQQYLFAYVPLWGP